MPAVKHNIDIEQGATFEFNMKWIQEDEVTPVDITGYTARMHVRESVESATILLELTTANLRIALGDAAGTIRILVSAADTAALNFTQGVYDLELVNTGGDGKVTRLIEGGVEVRPEVTR